MSVMEHIKIQAKNIHAAAGEIIDVLEDTSKGNVIYFSGWGGFGASAVLKVVAQRLESSKSQFEKVIHVDCSVWKSTRALQKAVAKELEFPQSEMAIFDKQDEEDDLNVIEEGSRGVISAVTAQIFRKLANSRFVVVFHNGSEDYIDLYACGVPVTRFLGNKVLWTWHGRFRLLEPDDSATVKDMWTEIFIAPPDSMSFEEFSYVLCEEAKEVVTHMGIPGPDMNHKIVEVCFLYAMRHRHAKGIKWGTHASKYWVCLGIIQGEGDTTAWEVGDALERNMHLHWLLQDTRIPFQEDIDEAICDHLKFPYHCWYSGTHQIWLEGDIGATSFLLSDKPDSRRILPDGMFHCSHSRTLRVLHLSGCTFHFAFPPFLSCSQLRLLHLDHCTNITDDDERPSYNENISCFQKLWVLDLRYTQWYWLLSEKMKRLMVELRELNVEGVKHGSISDLCSGRPSLVILRVTEAPVPTENEDTNNQAQFPNMSNTNSFINNVLPPQLESFSFINKAATAAKISSISFQGCSRLKSILLRGNLGSLEELDLSGTAVKTLDLRDVEAPNLKRFILLGCEKLCAILWPPGDNRRRFLNKLHINTIRSALPSQAISKEKTNEANSAKRSSSILPVAATQPDIFTCNWYIAVNDARLLRSLEPIKQDFWGYTHIEMNSSPASRGAQRIMSLQQPDHYSYARDIVFQDHLQDGAGNEGTISWIWACPPRPTPSAVHIQDEHEMKGGLVQQEQSSIEGTSTSATIPPSFMCDKAHMLHVHDGSSITCIPCPQGSTWNLLKWCSVKRCPNLCSVFATPPNIDGNMTFRLLSTFWASQLPKACYIWNWSTTSQPSGGSFEYLKFLHLDCCPRLIHVLPLSEHMTALRSLETLEIVCCGDLMEVFPLNPKRQEKQEIIYFPNLRRIHLYELPMLQRICGSRMSAPNLETVKIRGCWSLRHLPAVSGKTAKRPKVDCEKDWWDNLEWVNWRDCHYWNRVETKHDPSLYEPNHSRYYKKADLPRGTVLR